MFNSFSKCGYAFPLLESRAFYPLPPKAIRSKYPDKKGYSTRNLIYMCQFAKAYPLEVLIEMGKVEKLLDNPSVDNVLQLTCELNQFTQEPLA